MFHYAHHFERGQLENKFEGDNKEKSNAAVRRELCAESESNKAETEAKSG